jgi:hypothetical protein
LGKVQKRVHKAVQDGEIRKGDSVDDDLELGWELDLGIRGESKASKRAESAFRENPEIKKRIPSTTGKYKTRSTFLEDSFLKS